jgi:hypothetical protein
MPAGLFHGTSSRSGHIAYIQVLNDDHRVVFADGGSSLVEVIAASIGDANLDALGWLGPSSSCGRTSSYRSWLAVLYAGRQHIA